MKFPATTVHTFSDSPLGRVILAASADKLLGMWFVEGQSHPIDPSNWPAAPQNLVLQQAKVQLNDYFAGHRTAFELPLSLETGTEFQQKVWHALLTIPCGTTCSYGQLSANIGHPTAVRAVGAAVGRNPLSIIVPCHRVMGADGTLTGYAGGLDRKTALLRLEGALPMTRQTTLCL